MTRTAKTFERGEAVEVLRESWMSSTRFEPATYDSACDTISRERHHWVVLPDSAPPLYVSHGMTFDEPGPNRVETRKVLVPSRRIRKRSK